MKDKINGGKAWVFGDDIDIDSTFTFFCLDIDIFEYQLIIIAQPCT